MRQEGENYSSDTGYGPSTTLSPDPTAAPGPLCKPLQTLGLVPKSASSWI